ncbi:molybdopterin converting factor subunit 1 [Cytobacillus sp. Hz8]|uniref:molybdopterin converting factor subunit 1 n=1 Tax=Cytobacillus sp. Hz8 TaxID=3347168 RepID=UPI0035D5AEAE
MNKILFFAHLKDIVGKDFILLDLAGKSVAEVKQIISETYKVMNLETVMTAVNEEFASNEEIIRAGDEIAFIPPVSGG